MSYRVAYQQDLFRRDGNGQFRRIDPNQLQEIKILGQTPNSSCVLVRRIIDSKQFVRKTTTHPPEIERERDNLQGALPQGHRRIINLEPWAPTFPLQHGLLFEYCPGGDLFNLVHPHPHLPYSATKFPEEFVWHVMLHLAEALAFIHYGYDSREDYQVEAKEGWEAVIHRDVKCANIFFRTEYPSKGEGPWPTPVLADFGHATTNSVTKKWTTREVMPPELPRWTKRGDVWGLGAVIHEMVHGRNLIEPPTVATYWPRGNKNYLDVPESRKPREAPKRYSSLLNRFLLSCLAWDPKDRPTSLKLYERLRDEVKGGK